MSDPMGEQMPMAPAAPDEQDSTDALLDNRSFFNPADLAMMVQSGELSPETTIEEYLGMLGLTPQNTMQDMAMVMQKQMKLGSPIGKMQAIAAAGQPGQAPPGAPQAGPAGPPPTPGRRPEGQEGFGDLMKRL
jgi:hypothetical protein